MQDQGPRWSYLEKSIDLSGTKKNASDEQNANFNKYSRYASILHYISCIWYMWKEKSSS